MASDPLPATAQDLFESPASAEAHLAVRLPRLASFGVTDGLTRLDANLPLSRINRGLVP